MNLDLSTDGTLLPLLVAAGIGIAGWFFGGRKAPNPADPMPAWLKNLMDELKRRQDAEAADKLNKAVEETIAKLNTK